MRASTGELAWYFQPTPGDNWDYDATQPLIQADLNIGGRVRNVLMQANKNGFFYVLDRKFPPEGQRRRQSDADLSRTEMEQAVPRSAAEGILNAVRKLGLQQ